MILSIMILSRKLLLENKNFNYCSYFPGKFYLLGYGILFCFNTSLDTGSLFIVSTTQQVNPVFKKSHHKFFLEEINE